MKMTCSCKYFGHFINQGEWWCMRQFDEGLPLKGLSKEDYEIIMNCDCDHCQYKEPIVWEMSEI